MAGLVSPNWRDCVDNLNFAFMMDVMLGLMNKIRRGGCRVALICLTVTIFCNKPMVIIRFNVDGFDSHLFLYRFYLPIGTIEYPFAIMYFSIARK
jgi:hypothetical protein